MTLHHLEQIAGELRLAVQDATVTACLAPNADDLKRIRLIQEALNVEFNRARQAIVRCADEASRARAEAAIQHYREVA